MVEVMDEVKKSYVELLLNNGERADKRGFFDYRNIEITKGVIQTSDGSAWVKLGNTQVLASVKFDVVAPFSDRPQEGVLSTSAELLPMASPRFEPGPPSEEAIELARVVDRAIRSAEIIDMKKMFIEEDKVYGMYIDLYVLDYDGNYFDAASLAAMAALRNAKVPVYKDGKLVRDGSEKPLELKGDALEFTFVKIGEHILLDPSLDEEHSADVRLTVGICGDMICSMQKNGRSALKRAEVEKMVDVSLEKFNELDKLVRQ